MSVEFVRTATEAVDDAAMAGGGRGASALHTTVEVGWISCETKMKLTLPNTPSGVRERT